jgi:competence protein ComEA
MPVYEDELPSSRIKDVVEKLTTTYRYHVLVSLGVILILGIGSLFFKGFFSKDNGSVQILEASSSAEVKGTSTNNSSDIVIEVSGEVEKPGVYNFTTGARIDDALEKAGGLTELADTDWIAKTLNRAAKLVDGQKLYIPAQSTSKQVEVEPRENHSDSLTAKELTTIAPIVDGRTIISQAQNGQVNINTASLSELDKLPGIGQVYGQKIIDHRPYSDINELVSKGAIKKTTFEKLKDKVSVY